MTRSSTSSTSTDSREPLDQLPGDPTVIRRIMGHLHEGRFGDTRRALHRLETELRTMSQADVAVLPALYARAELIRRLPDRRGDATRAATMLENAAVHHNGRADADAWLMLSFAMRARARLDDGEASSAMGDLARVTVDDVGDFSRTQVGFWLQDTMANCFAMLRMNERYTPIREGLEEIISARPPLDRATHWASWAGDLAARAMEPLARGAAEPDKRLLAAGVQLAERVDALGMDVPNRLRRSANAVLALHSVLNDDADEALRLLGSDAFGEPNGLCPPARQLAVIAALHAHTLVGSYATARSLDDNVQRSILTIPNIILEICRARLRLWLEKEINGDPGRARARLQDLLIRLAWTGMDLAAESSRQAMEHQVLHTQSRTDPVTGVGNRRAFDEDLHALLRFSPLPLSLILIDIDDFKQINDDYSHVVGDEVLRYVAEVLSDELPGEARLLRYGGDEFVVLLPGTGEAAARDVAVRLTRAIAGFSWSQVADNMAIRATTGLSALFALSGRRPAADAERLFRRADEALLEAKRGRKHHPHTEILDLRDPAIVAAAAQAQNRQPTAPNAASNGQARTAPGQAPGQAPDQVDLTEVESREEHTMEPGDRIVATTRRARRRSSVIDLGQN